MDDNLWLAQSWFREQIEVDAMSRFSRTLLIAMLSVGFFASNAFVVPVSAQSAAGTTNAGANTVDPNIEALAKKTLQNAQAGIMDRSTLTRQANVIATPALVKDVAKSLRALGALTAFSFLQRQTAVDPKNHERSTGYIFLATFGKKRFNWYLDLTSKKKIASIRIWPYEAKMHLGEDRLLEAIASKVTAESEKGDFSGAIVLAKNGRPVFSRASGFADREQKIANTLETRFRIGSMNKMFTAVATLQLVEAGKIRLDAPFGVYVPDYPNKTVSSKVTIRELLTHTGGTGDIFGPKFGAHRLQLRTLDDYMHLFGSRGLTYTPGSRFQYSNYGFVLLGIVIEKVSGESYYRYVRQHVYEPAGMTSTGSAPENQPVQNRSIGYTMDHGKIQPNTDMLPYRGTSAGGGYSTVGDLLRFANALQSNTLLDAHYTQMLTKGKVDMPTPPDVHLRYAFGFGDQMINGNRCFGHDGGAPGMSGNLAICPGPGYTVVVLENIDPPAADQLSDFVLNRLPLTPSLR